MPVIVYKAKIISNKKMSNIKWLYAWLPSLWLGEKLSYIDKTVEDMSKFKTVSSSGNWPFLLGIKIKKKPILISTCYGFLRVSVIWTLCSSQSTLKDKFETDHLLKPLQKLVPVHNEINCFLKEKYTLTMSFTLENNSSFNLLHELSSHARNGNMKRDSIHALFVTQF